MKNQIKLKLFFKGNEIKFDSRPNPGKLPDHLVELVSNLLKNSSQKETKYSRINTIKLEKQRNQSIPQKTINQELNLNNFEINNYSAKFNSDYFEIFKFQQLDFNSKIINLKLNPNSIKNEILSINKTNSSFKILQKCISPINKHDLLNEAKSVESNLHYSNDLLKFSNNKTNYSTSDPNLRADLSNEMNEQLDNKSIQYIDLKKSYEEMFDILQHLKNQSTNELKEINDILATSISKIKLINDEKKLKCQCLGINCSLTSNPTNKDLTCINEALNNKCLSRSRSSPECSILNPYSHFPYNNYELVSKDSLITTCYNVYNLNDNQSNEMDFYPESKPFSSQLKDNEDAIKKNLAKKFQRPNLVCLSLKVLWKFKIFILLLFLTIIGVLYFVYLIINCNLNIDEKSICFNFFKQSIFYKSF